MTIRPNLPRSYKKKCEVGLGKWGEMSFGWELRVVIEIGGDMTRAKGAFVKVRGEMSLTLDYDWNDGGPSFEGKDCWTLLKRTEIALLTALSVQISLSISRRRIKKDQGTLQLK